MRTIFRLSLYVFFVLLAGLPLIGLMLEATGIGTAYLPQPWIDLLHYEWHKNTISLWLRAGLLAIITGLGIHLIDTLLETRLSNTARPKQHRVLRLLNLVALRTSTIFIVVVALGTGLSVLALPDKAESVIGQIMHIIVLVQVAIWINVVVSDLIDDYVRRREERNPAIRSALALIHMVAAGIVWALTTVAILNALGFDVTALVAGLGIGGAAIALASQKILSDIFSSLGLVLDKPFGVGDYIIMGDQRGNVEDIGVKTTRIRSQSGEQIIIPNTDMLQARIHNYRRMEERRVVQRFNISYETPQAQLAMVPDMLKGIVEKHANVRYSHTFLDAFAFNALEFEMVYTVLSSNYQDYVQTKQAINMAILATFADSKIHFAYPALAAAH